MHAGAMESREKWSHPCRYWRKREAYIALMRHIQKPGEAYAQWDCFQFKDYEARQQWAATFRKRHLPLSNGDPKNFHGRIQNPDCWDSTADKEPPRKRPKLKKEDRASCPIADQEVRVYDVEKGCFVSL